MATPRTPEPAARLAPGIVSLRADQVAGEVLPALREAGIRSILLKGPSIAAWLYTDGKHRPYKDVDLLVEDRRLASAGEVLEGLGFRRRQPGWREVSWSWQRREDGGLVDLHRSLFGVGAAPEIVWRELTTRTELLAVGGTDAETLARPALALHVAIHAAEHGVDALVRPRTDLARALELVGDECWREAAALAERIDAVPVFATGLRLDPLGAALAERMQLPRSRPLEIALHATRPSPLVLPLEYLRTADGFRARLRFVLRKLFPTPAELRNRSALARSGRAGLCLAYVWRPLRALVELPVAVRDWRRARAAESGARSAR